MNIIKNFSPNFSEKKRKKSQIKFIIIHYTGMQSKRASIDRLLGANSKVSCHYLIDRMGEVIQIVEDHKVSWHAGKSKWKKYENLNKNSIGIELVNKGHEFGYQKFTTLQISSLVKVCLLLKKKYKIKKQNILGHSDIAPLRKKDPGEYFPWRKLSRNGIGIWYPTLKSRFKKIKNKKIRNIFFKNLYKIGYRYFDLRVSKKTDKKIVESFKAKFSNNKIDGLIDEKTLNISHYLTSSMKN